MASAAMLGKPITISFRHKIRNIRSNGSAPLRNQPRQHEQDSGCHHD